MQSFEGLQGELHYDHPLARYTSWRIGGPADVFYRPKDRDDLIHFLKQIPNDMPVTWLGLGSNTLIRDAGVRGVVILTLGRLNVLHEENDCRVYAEAGVTCAKLSKLCAKLGYEDGVFFCGIPGTIGGALYMNAGAFGGETWPHVVTVTTVDRQGNVTIRDASTFTFGYRHITGLGDEYFLDATFQFKSGSAQKAAEAIKTLLHQRSESQPIGVFSCGSTFTNPDGDYAGRLIEQCNLKGFRIGGAQVSDKHANFLINVSNATSKDMEALIAHIKKTVKAQCGVMLQEEYRVIGELS